jgi:hypothetical protein
VTLQTICLHDVAPQPWKNGGGETRELLTWPQKSGWALRLSVADITRNGPFSEFKNIRRWIAVLEGTGMHLGEPFNQSVVAGMPPFPFDGQYAAPCELIDGPTRDLNLMIDSQQGKGEMRALSSAPSAQTFVPLHAHHDESPPNIVGVFCLSEIKIQTLEAQLAAPPCSLVWSDDDTRSWQAHFVGQAWTFQCTLNVLGTSNS